MQNLDLLNHNALTFDLLNCFALNSHKNNCLRYGCMFQAHFARLFDQNGRIYISDHIHLNCLCLLHQQYFTQNFIVPSHHQKSLES